jgi:hypothetical protein
MKLFEFKHLLANLCPSLTFLFGLRLKAAYLLDSLLFARRSVNNDPRCISCEALVLEGATHQWILLLLKLRLVLILLLHGPIRDHTCS